MTHVEGNPTDEQKHRLEDWLTELMIICRKHRIVLMDTGPDCEGVQLVDIDARSVIGIGLTHLSRERGGRVRLTGYDCTDSILDGTWPVDTPDGPADQREAGHVWPQPRYPSDYSNPK